MNKVLIASFTLMISLQAFSSDAVMERCAGAMDIAESNLRILLSKPAHGKVPQEWSSGSAKLEASKRLLRLEMRSPGCMNGAAGNSNWSQYKTVRALHDELMGADKLGVNEIAEIKKKLIGEKSPSSDCGADVSDVSSNTKSELPVSSPKKINSSKANQQ